MSFFSACIFDLDGVIVDTAKYHYKAWRRLANSLGFDFSEIQNEALKGVSRRKSLEWILNLGNKALEEEEFLRLMEQKNTWYLEFIDQMGDDEILDGVVPFLDELVSQKKKIALGSASKNAPRILDKINLSSYFEAIIDGNAVTRSKPDPEVFQIGAQQLGCNPRDCIVFEDAPKGIEAALRGGFLCVGVGDPAHLGEAHMVIPGFSNFRMEHLEPLRTFQQIQ